MIRRDGEYKSEFREEMRGGTGSVKIEELWAPGTEMRSKNRMVSRLTLKPGDSIGFHPHDAEDEIFFVIKGRAEANDNGNLVELGVGDTILTGNGDGHAIRCIGDEPLELIAVITAY